MTAPAQPQPWSSKAIRAEVFARLEAFARPDSRYHLDFAEFIPDFAGSDQASRRVQDMPAYRSARHAFVTPDPALIGLRHQMLLDGKTLVVSTHGIRRGFVLLDPARITPDQAPYAAWLDGMERFGTPVSLAQIRARGAFDLMLTGASAVSRNGVRFGKGHGYFDMEWGMFTDLGLAGPATPVVAVVHDVQVVPQDLVPGPTDILVDWIATPTTLVQVARGSRPAGIRWDLLSPEQVAHTPPLQELMQLQSGAGS